MVISPKAFGQLWDHLEEAGLFELPRSREAEPPKDRPYFLVRSGDERWLLERPTPATLKADDPRIPLLDRWRRAKVAIFRFSDSLEAP